MKNIECIIIEDEFPATEILKGYIKEIPNWALKASFENAIDALHFLSNHKVDVIFVDIQLPKLSGISFIKTLDNPPIIIITSAYSEHAIEAFELVVFDYLLKPYSFERFIKTINRLNEQFTPQKQRELNSENAAYILVKENRNHSKVYLDEINFLESQKEYVNIVCHNRILKTKIGISKISESLPANNFLRIHRSFIVRIDKIDSFSKKKIIINEHTLAIGRFYQKEVLARLEG